QATAWVPNATRKDHFVPRNVRTGAELPDEDTLHKLEPAVRCTLDTGSEQKEVWVRMSRPGATRVAVGTDVYLFRYHMESRPVSLKLRRTAPRQEVDPGSDRPAAFRSEVTLMEKEGGKEVSSDHSIFMNNTLDVWPYRCYQANYSRLTDPDTFQPVTD